MKRVVLLTGSCWAGAPRSELVSRVAADKRAREPA
jgi:hypothetical protein